MDILIWIKELCLKVFCSHYSDNGSYVSHVFSNKEFRYVQSIRMYKNLSELGKHTLFVSIFCSIRFLDSLWSPTGSWVAQSIKKLVYGLDDWGSIPSRGNSGIFYLCHCVQTGSGAHATSCPMGTAGFSPSGKAARAWRWPLTSISCHG
jgi:hypothetical protein